MLRTIGTFVGVSLPTILLLLWSVDAALMVGTDVFIIALLQFIFLAVYMWRSNRATTEKSQSEPTASESETTPPQ